MARSRSYGNQGRDGGRVHRYNGGNSGSWNKNKVPKATVARSKYGMKETRKRGPSDKMLLVARPEEIMLNSDAFLEGEMSMVALPVSAALKAKYENVVLPGQSKTVNVTCAVASAQVDGCTDLDVEAFCCPPPEGRERISITSGMFDVGRMEGGRHRLLTLEERGRVDQSEPFEVLDPVSDEPTKLHPKDVSVFGTPLKEPPYTSLVRDDVKWTEWDRDVSELESPMKSGAVRLGETEGSRQLGGFTNRGTKFLRAYCKLEESFKIKASKTEAGTVFVECTPPVEMMLKMRVHKPKSASGGMENAAAKLEQGEAMTDGRLGAIKIRIYHKEV